MRRIDLELYDSEARAGTAQARQCADAFGEDAYDFIKVAMDFGCARKQLAGGGQSGSV